MDIYRYSWLFDIVRIKGSITLQILGPVLTCTLFATLVAVAHLVYDYHIHLTNQVVPLLSVVVGLILVFRYVLESPNIPSGSPHIDIFGNLS